MGNTADRWRHGTMPVGSKAYNHKLTVTVRVEVLDLWANGATKAEIGRSVGISRRSVQRVIEKMT
jgi:DNA-binding transcriptional regulator LsrR (DeoR family)